MNVCVFVCAFSGIVGGGVGGLLVCVWVRMMRDRQYYSARTVEKPSSFNRPSVLSARSATCAAVT